MTIRCRLLEETRMDPAPALSETFRAAASGKISRANAEPSRAAVLLLGNPVKPHEIRDEADPQMAYSGGNRRGQVAAIPDSRSQG
jgi:hypothetical protein